MALHNLYFTLIHCHLTYANIIWGNNYNTIIDKIQILQNKSVRLVFKGNTYLDTNNLFEKFKILKMVNIYQQQASIFIFKHIHYLLPTIFYITNFLELHKDSTTRNLRNNRDLYIPYAHTNTRLFTIKYSGPRIWNSLPAELRSIINIIHFKKNLKKFLLQSQSAR